ncbi:CcdB family protein [Rhizobium alvei]|uniref:Toxin CcdB n=1 Tax=Rhizobium alvei TaxID=1132659 RepID=A0ABT8YQA6_9HYPH|nr:CcdB family protein [Rhizobium alvei]MDO6965543.1 CcdB family protein [Rhizobium alvei]
MPRFHVYRLRRDDTLLLDLQADLLDVLKTRIVAPLIPVDQMPWAIAHLNPHFEVAGKQYVMATQRMAAISTSEIGPYVADLSQQRDRIVAATDFLFQGF